MTQGLYRSRRFRFACRSLSSDLTRGRGRALTGRRAFALASLRSDWSDTELLCRIAITRGTAEARPNGRRALWRALAEALPKAGIAVSENKPG